MTTPRARRDADIAAYLQELTDKHNAGWSQRALAAHFGVSRSAIQYDLRRVPLLAGTRLPGVSTAAVIPNSGSSVSAGGFAGGRLTLDKSGGIFGDVLGKYSAIEPPPDDEHDWRLLGLDRNALSTIPASKLLGRLRNLSPHISRAVWDFLRLFNPGWEVHAFNPGTDTPNAQGQAALDAFLATLADRHGSVDEPINRLGIGAFLNGALLAELVLDEAGRMPIELATPDPGSVRFRREWDPVLGVYWQLGQWQVADFVAFDRPTVRYIAIDPNPGSPYGNAPVAPALFPALFLLGLFHDLRRVIAQQGYPRIHIQIDLAALREAMPEYDRDNADEFKKWVDDAYALVRREYAALEPDDAYVSTSAIKVGAPVGTVDSSSLGAVGGMIVALERMLVAALKTMPLMMGITDGVSEANANRQWEIHAQGIKSIQHLAETLLERLFTLGLEAQGINATVEFRFSELRAAEMLRDAQTEQLLLANAETAIRLGFMDQDEASIYAIGHPAAKSAEEMAAAAYDAAAAAMALAQATAAPSVATDGSAPDASTVNPDPGANRQRAVVPVQPIGAGGALPPLDHIVLTDADIRDAAREWDRAMPDEDGLLDATIIDEPEAAD